MSNHRSARAPKLTSGTAFLHGGHRFKLLAAIKATPGHAAQSRWETRCADCGAAFRFVRAGHTPLLRKLPKRCRRCRAGQRGVPATDTAARNRRAAFDRARKLGYLKRHS